VKSAHRFDFGRFGEALVERGLIDREVLNHVLHQCNATRALLPEVLVRENLVSDWELSRVACELYHLPFMTVEICPPSSNALDGYDANYLRHYALVPLDRFGSLVTVVMPGLVPSEVLEGLRPGQGGRVLAVVGSVLSNRRWLSENLPQGGGPLTSPAAPAAPLGTRAPERRTISMEGFNEGGLDVDAEVLETVESDWGNIFDAGDEAVQIDLRDKKRRP
jgi:hypothetical protein